MGADGVRKEGSSPLPPWEPLLSTEHKVKEKIHNTKPGGQPGQGFPPRDAPSSGFPSQPPTPRGGIAIPHTQTIGGDMWIPSR